MCHFFSPNRCHGYLHKSFVIFLQLDEHLCVRLTSRRQQALFTSTSAADRRSADSEKLRRNVQPQTPTGLINFLPLLRSGNSVSSPRHLQLDCSQPGQGLSGTCEEGAVMDSIKKKIQQPDLILSER